MKVFICYSRHDRAAVSSLADELKSAAQNVSYDNDLRGGTTWWNDILEQIRLCTVFVFAVSEKSMISKPCQAELRYAQELGIPVLFLIIGQIALDRYPRFATNAIDYRDSSRAGALALMSALHERARERAPLPDPLPEAPPLPHDFLLRIGGMIRSPGELTPDNQQEMLLDLQDGLEEEEDETVRDDARKLLLGLRSRSDVTYTTANRIDELLAAHAPPAPTTEVPVPGTEFSGPVTLPPPVPPVAPFGGVPQFAPLAGPANWPAPQPLPPGPGSSSGNAKLIWTVVSVAVLAVAVIVVAILAWPKPKDDPGAAANSSSSSSSSTPSSTSTSPSVPPRSTEDTAFLKVLKDKGISFPSEEYAIDTAKQVCSLLDDGQKAVDIAKQISKNSGISIDEAGFFVGASIGAYCPRHADQAN